MILHVMVAMASLLVIGVHVYLFPVQLFLLESEQQWTVPCTAE